MKRSFYRQSSFPIKHLFLLALILLRRCDAFLSRVLLGPTSTRPPPSRSSSTSTTRTQKRLQLQQQQEVNGEKQVIEGLLNASASYGSLLIQMQKQNESLEDQGVLDLDHHRPVVSSISTVPRSNTTTSSVKTPASSSTKTGPQAASLFKSSTTMSVEAARELDDAIIPLSLSAAREELTILPLGPLYAAAAATMDKDEASPSAVAVVQPSLLPLSRPEHYQDRIGRDMRHLSINIASAAETEAQWRLFCQEGGGLYPLLEAIREGTSRLQQHRRTEETACTPPPPILRLNNNNNKERESNYFYEDDLLLAACNACRALRDVAAISPEVAAILTDGILRANAAWKGGLLADLKTCLAYAPAALDTSSTADSSSSSSSSEQQQQEPQQQPQEPPHHKEASSSPLARRRNRREAQLRSQLYVQQLLLAMTFASDDAVTAIRETPGLPDAILSCSSYARKEQTRRWLRYPGELVKFFWRRSRNRSVRGPFLEAANIGDDLKGQVQKIANQVLAAIGYNHWVPKAPAQKGLRILCLDGGGSRGMASITCLRSLMEYVGEGVEVADAFDLLGGTSTGGIISFLTGLRAETCVQASERYNQLIKQIFVKSALSTPRLFLTTASYDETHFMDILSKILGDMTMLDSRSDPSTPFVFCVTSKMSSTPTHVALFRNYNYASGELGDHFTIDPMRAREEVGIPLEMEHEEIRSGRYSQKEASRGSPGVRSTSNGSRHPGSFRVLQRYALRASTAAPTVFKPVSMAGELYCDGGIVASNPTAVAIHEARTLFPDVPIEMVVSFGTGAFLEQKSSPRIGWDGIIGQIVNSACDGEQIHHLLEDIIGDPRVIGRGSSVSATKYYRFNPVVGLPDEFPIDVTDPGKLAKLRQISIDYMNEPAQQAKMKDIAGILKGRNRWSRWISR